MEQIAVSKLVSTSVYSKLVFFLTAYPLWWIIAGWVLLEIGFALVVYYFLLPDLYALKVPTQYHGDIVTMMKRTLDQVHALNSYTFEMYLRGFFNMAKFEEIHVDNFRSFLSWCMFHKHLKDLSLKEVSAVTEVLNHVTYKHPEILDLKIGNNPKISHCSMTLEPLPMIHRPLLLYALVNVIEHVSNCVLLHACGFKRFSLDGANYWYKHQDLDRIYKKLSSGREPLVFLHGISTGWLVYTAIVRALGENRTLLLLDVEAIKVKSLNFDMPTPERFVDRVKRILDRHNIDKASFVGHSFGSITAGWFVRYFPERVSHLTLIDPVSLLLGLPDVAYSFLYRKPRTFMEWVIFLGAGQEVTVSSALRRHFFWYNNNLWLEDIPPQVGVVVGLAAQDEIIDAAAVHEYVQNCRALRLQCLPYPRSTPDNSHAKSSSSREFQSRRLTRSMTIAPSVDHAQNKIDENGSEVNLVESAEIVVVKWAGFSHGQILLPSQEQQQFVRLVHANEQKLTKQC